MGKKVLVVDDSATVRQSLSFTLQNAGYEPVEAVNGLVALKILEKKFDLVITDLNMPVMDGMEFIRKVRASDVNKFTPILMLTTEGSVAKKEEGRAAGATGWIVKPFQPEQLLAVVAKVLR